MLPKKFRGSISATILFGVGFAGLECHGTVFNKVWVGIIDSQGNTSPCSIVITC
jgi:hypothetical protein